MLGSGFKAERLRVNLRLVINRLKLLEKKKTELAQKARKEIADYLSTGKDERARIRVEHIIREDYLVEAMEILELYCDLLLARFGLIQSMKNICLSLIILHCAQSPILTELSHLASFLSRPGFNAPPVAKPRSKAADNFVLPELPSVPDTLPTASAGAGPSSSEDIDFDDLSRRFEELKKKT
ncbi:LOW QUALITY PROTEIN: IST1 homolog [Hyperolius riggenbachi]|uniref:LOW QUALITY PROTEIN: IST1 homolog n=1 Tax=Hyperolius riggenbachi TaxID=752182 RepID=UPI0035A33BD4